MEFQKQYILELATNLLNIDSPSGYTHQAIAFLKIEAEKLGYRTSMNEKANYINIKCF